MWNATLQSEAPDHTYTPFSEGSKVKHVFIRNSLIQDGFSEEEINRIYGPVGLNISNQLPEEIAVSIMSEILLVKNNGTLEHRKDI